MKLDPNSPRSRRVDCRPDGRNAKAVSIFCEPAASPANGIRTSSLPRAWAAGDDPTVARAAHEAWSRDVPQAGAPANDLGRGRRTVRNAYGDEIVVEK